ncbi:MAG: hypothetical protein GF401_03175 [Chitinivibrionales bacterium]|nr:hypothetical protein [Chitinivibrionales bacterium]
MNFSDSYAITGDFLTTCNDFYSTVSTQSSNTGLKKKEVDRSAGELAVFNKGHYYLHTTAYKPTGLALGFPLPDPDFKENLWNISMEIKRHLRMFSPQSTKLFAHVPPESYHVTIVNRKHFDNNDLVEPLSSSEKDRAENVIQKLQIGEVAVYFNGFIISNEGRVLVRGYVFDNRLFYLRKKLTEIGNIFKDRIPVGAHIKLGHVLIQLDKHELKTFNQRISYLSEQISALIKFNDCYTQQGQISFR